MESQVHLLENNNRYLVDDQIGKKVGSDILSNVHPLILLSRPAFRPPRKHPSPTRGKALGVIAWV